MILFKSIRRTRVLATLEHCLLNKYHMMGTNTLKEALPKKSAKFYVLTSFNNLEYIVYGQYSNILA